jgi:hypothetical protein
MQSFHHSFLAFLAITALSATCLLVTTPAAAEGGGGISIRPGYVPSHSVIDLPSGRAVTLAFGGRGVGYVLPFLRMGGEGYWDSNTRIGTGGFLIDGAIPLGLVELQFGGVVGGGRYGLFLEPGFGVQIGQGPVVFEVRLSYQWHPVRQTEDPLDYHRGLTYLSFSLLFGKF